MTREGRVAAIVPLHNGARFITATMRSILDQEAAAEEIVVVDDGSTDGGLEIVRSLCPGATIVRHAQAAGTVAARAAGVAASEAEWLAFCDHDDLWPAGRMVALRTAAQAAAARWCSGRTHLAPDPGYNPPNGVMRAHGTHVPYLPSASLIHRSAWDLLGGMNPDLHQAEDVDFYLRFRETCGEVHLVDAVTLVHRLHDASVSERFNRSAADDTFAVIRSAARRRRQASSDG